MNEFLPFILSFNAFVLRMFSGKNLGAQEKSAKLQKLKCILTYFNLLTTEGNMIHITLFCDTLLFDLFP
jgi:hypothetical protein